MARVVRNSRNVTVVEVLRPPEFFGAENFPCCISRRHTLVEVVAKWSRDAKVYVSFLSESWLGGRDPCTVPCGTKKRVRVSSALTVVSGVYVISRPTKARSSPSDRPR